MSCDVDIAYEKGLLAGFDKGHARGHRAALKAVDEKLCGMIYEVRRFGGSADLTKGLEDSLHVVRQENLREVLGVKEERS